MKDNETEQAGSSNKTSDLSADVYLNCQSQHQQFWVSSWFFYAFTGKCPN